jgi:hypothetical protein
LPSTNQCILISGVALYDNLGFSLLEENSIGENYLAALELVVYREQISHEPLKVHALPLVHPIDDQGSPLSILIAPTYGRVNNCCASFILHYRFANCALASKRPRTLGWSCVHEALCILTLILSLQGVRLSERWGTLEILLGPSVIYRFEHEYEISLLS